MTREEALQAIKEKMDYYESDKRLRGAIETLIPELAESEDERIIDGFRTLLDGIKRSQGLTLNKVPLDKCYSWLEKQKDLDKMIVVSPEVWDNAISDAFENGKKEGEKQKESLKDFIDDFPYSDEQKDNKFTPRVLPCSAAWFEDGDDKQKEQKTIKWTDLTWKDIVELEGIINNVHYDFSAGIGQESFGKEVLERFRSTKGIEYLDEAEQKCWREEQKEQKQEWSEEDKEKIVTISEIIEHCTTIPYSGGTLTLNKEYKKELLCFIKSLRPTTKK